MSMVVRVMGILALVLGCSTAQAQNKVPSERGLEALVKTTLLSFNDANVTGNYEVFHAKSSKPFRDQFTADRLKFTFRDFGKKQLDFDVIADMKPAYDPPPQVDDDGKLLVKGSFPTEPLRVYFDLDFIPSDGEWKLIRINVKVDSPP